MGFTSYTQPDFINIVALVESFVAVPAGNIGTPPNMHCSGVEGGGYTSPTNPVGGYSPQNVDAQVVYTWDLDHAGVLSPIPANARITKITIQQQVTNLAAAASLTAIFEDPPPALVAGDGSSGVGVALNSVPSTFSNPPPPNGPGQWVTSQNFVSESASDSDTLVGNVDTEASLSEPLLLQVVFDISTNPNGDFPLQYMDYATFIANFSSYITAYSVGASNSANIGAGSFPFDPLSVISGTFSATLGIEATGLTVLVEWNSVDESGWTVDPTLAPPYIVELTNDEDDEPLKSVTIGNTVIGPEDPWVIVWTKNLIKIHLPPDETDDPEIIIETQFGGTVNLGPIVVTIADLSGIYQLDINAHEDTLYERTGTPTTQEVAIPAPFLITYFVDNKETDILHFAGTRIRIKGTGVAHQQIWSLDTVHTAEFGNLTLKPSNNISPFSLVNFNDQQGAIRIYTDAINEFMEIGEIIVFFKKLFTGYPQ